MNNANRKSKRIQALIGSALPLLLIGSLQADTSLAAERPDFSGFWQLNEELSENPREKMRKSMGQGGSRGGSGGRGGGMGGGAGGPGGGRGGSGREDMQDRMRAMAERIQTLEITHQEPDLSFVFADGSGRTIHTDGRDSADDLEGGVLEGKGTWKNQTQFVFKSETPNGSKMTEIYELNASGELLLVTVKMEGDGRRPDLKFRRVYDIADAGIPVEPDPGPGR